MKTLVFLTCLLFAPPAVAAPPDDDVVEIDSDGITQETEMQTTKCLFAAVHAPDWIGLGTQKLDKVFRCGIVGVDVRIASIAHGPTKDEIDLVRRVLDAGLSARIHTWAGVRLGTDGPSKATASDGTRQGKLLADMTRALKVTSLASGNFERDVWRGPGRYANPKAVDFIEAYIDAFRASSPGCALGDLGFADPDEHYVDADLDKDGDVDDELPEHVVMQFARRGIMAYQSDAASVRNKLAKGRAVAAEGQPLSWWGSVGRVDPKAGVVGSFAVTQELCIAQPSGIDEWVGYVGFGSIGQLLDGHAKHPPLVALVRTLAHLDHPTAT